MRPLFKLGFLGLWLGIAIAGPAARARTDEAVTVLLSAEQGQALADFALHTGPRVRPKPDCSHLVHLLYSRAGLNYTYEDSRVLHRGSSDFQRVKVPQAGDLVVWLGHVGIVLSPEDNSFLSSVRSGIITESWTGDYWGARGRPRFFRYIVGPNADLNVLAALAEPAGQPGSESPQQHSLLAGKRAPSQGIETELPAPAFAPPDDDSSDFSSIIATIHRRGKPDKQDINTALRQSERTLAEQLRTSQLLNPDRPLSVLERFEVLAVKIKHDEGTVSLRVSEVLTLDHGRAAAGNTIERKLNIERQNDSWVISDPHRRLFLPREKAVAVFEHQAGLVLQSDATPADKRGMVKALNLLYDREPPVTSASSEARR